MHLDPFYRVTFTTPESWSVTREGTGGKEGQSFLIAEGRAAGGLSARYRAADFPRGRVDGVLEPSFRGVLETDDGASILFQWDALARLTPSGMRQLLGAHRARDRRAPADAGRGPSVARRHRMELRGGA
jgi:hypothetical protein